ncbi:MAG: cation transporter, partial [Candidatus Riflebacteria bacterium]|nr:cation transporter [Candidatus Riflebacteria bacterium]
TGNTEAAKIQNKVQEKVLSHDWVVQLHGFYIDIEKKEMRFDAVMSFDIDPQEGLQTLNDEMKKEYPDYSIQIVPDVDVSD